MPGDGRRRFPLPSALLAFLEPPDLYPLRGVPEEHLDRAEKAERRVSSLKSASTQVLSMNISASGRAAHGKSLRSKSRKP
jgi:hypothetical protein